MISKLDALEQTALLWEWLAETGSDDKTLWPGWAAYKARFGEPAALCPCCHHTQKSSCSACPLLHLWGNPRGYCCSNDSPYEDWCDADTPDSRRPHAFTIARAAREAFEKERKESKGN